MNMDKNIQEIPIEDIIPNRFQPRLAFNEEGLKELAESIKQHGIIQPLVVRKLGDKYEIIAGERRYKASTMAGLTKVPAIISNIDDNKSAEVALVENIQRRNLSAIEEAKSYKNLLDRGYLTQEQLADKMGVSQSTIANKLRLLNLDNEVQDALLNEKISERHARSLLTLESKEDQRKWLKRIIEERMPVRQLDEELKNLKNQSEVVNSDTSDDEDGGIPLVQINPDIDEILSNARDINVENKSLKNPEDIFSLAEKPNEETSTILEEPEEIKSNNKFFNFLNEEPSISQTKTDQLDIFNSNSIEEPLLTNPVEYLDNDFTTVDQPSANLEDIPDIKEDIDTLNDTIPDSEKENYNSNIESDFEFLNLEGLVDPLDSIDELDPKYEEKQEQKAGTDLGTTINTIRENINGLKEKGINIEIEEADLADDYQIIIKIKK